MVNYVLGRMPSFVKKVASATNLESLREKVSIAPARFTAQTDR